MALTGETAKVQPIAKKTLPSQDTSIPAEMFEEDMEL